MGAGPALKGATPDSPHGLRAKALRSGLLAAALLALCLASCRNAARPAREWIEIAGPTMGTTYSVSLHAGTHRRSPAVLQRRIERILQRITDSMSTYDPQSELSRFNRSRRTGWTAVSLDTLTVVEEALRISALTDGAFDVTVGPLVNLWGFGPEGRAPAIPGSAAVEAARATVGFRHLGARRHPPAIRKLRPAMYVDLSAIAPGYAVDRIAGYLDGLGVERYLVEIGGEVRAEGTNPRGEPWRIGIERPVGGERSVQRVAQLSGQALATSGDYRNYLELEGRHYSHIIDPRTGKPVGHGLASVSVIRPSAMEADALATALMVLGPEGGLELAEREELPAYFIVHSVDGFAERHSPAFSQYLVP
ncbi:MAG: FAD:protein FMN transferase [Gammaproteobacteria bacterium]